MRSQILGWVNKVTVTLNNLTQSWPDAPLVPYGISLINLTRTNVNGLWSLYIADDYPLQDDGALANGWSLQFELSLPGLAASIEGTNAVVSCPPPSWANWNQPPP